MILVVGPTASGKTALAVALAERLGGELVNADSRQMIADLDVGVVKPTPAELRGIPCQGLDWRRLGAPFTAFDFVERARDAICAIAGRGRVPILVGGTGLYLRGLVRGFDFGQLPASGPRGGHSPGAGSASPGELARLAPEVAARTDLRNPRRVERALELVRAGAAPRELGEPWPAVWIGRRLSPAALRARIDRRTEWLLGPRLHAEVDRVLAAGVAPDVLADAAIGYAEALAWRAGTIGREEAVARVALRTWRYARRQRTWLRREPGVGWVGDDDADDSRVAEEAERLAAPALAAALQAG